MTDDLYADDPQYDAGGARKPSRKELAEERKAAADRRDQVTFLMSTKQGRALCYRWIADAGVFRETFVAGSPDVTANREGFRRFGLRVMNEILETVPDRFWLMVKENSGAEKEQ